MDSRLPVPYEIAVCAVGILIGVLLSMPSWAEVPDERELERELQDLTELVAQARNGDDTHLHLLVDRLTRARSGRQLSAAAEAALLESAMVIAPELVVDTLAVEVDLQHHGLADRADHRLAVVDAEQELRSGARRVTRTYERARRYEDELSMRCAFTRMVQLEQLRRLGTSAAEEFGGARSSRRLDDADLAMAKVVVVRGLADQRLAAAASCRIRYGEPWWWNPDPEEEPCPADLDAPSYDWVSGEYVPVAGCEDGAVDWTRF